MRIPTALSLSILCLAAGAASQAQLQPWRAPGAPALFAIASPQTAAPQTSPPPAPPAPPAPGSQGAPAQRPHPRHVELAEIPVSVLVTALSLTPEQKAKVTEIRDKLKNDLKAVPAGDKAASSNRELLATAHSNVEAVLTEEQKGKVQKLAFKIALLGFAGIPLDALSDMNLSVDQMDKISGVVSDALKNAPNSMKGLSPADRVAKTKEILASFQTTANSVLTADQRQKLEAYKKAHPVHVPAASSGAPAK